MVVLLHLSARWVCIDLLRARVTTRLQAVFDAIAMLALAFSSVIIAFRAWPVLAKSIESGSTANTTLETPLWIPQSLWFAGWLWFAVSAVVIAAYVLITIFTGIYEHVDSITEVKQSVILFTSTGLLILLSLSIPVGIVLFLLAFGIDIFFSPFPLFRGLSQIVWSSSNSATLIAIPFFVLLGELLVRKGKVWIGLASDHTDRDLEAHSVAASKQACSKLVATELWRYESVSQHVESLVLRCEIKQEGGWVTYQEGGLSNICPLFDLMATSGFGEGAAMLCGTLTAMGGVRPASEYKMMLEG